MEGITLSKLVFAAGHEGPEPVSIKDLKRVREPVSRSKSGIQGKVADVLHGRSRHAESQNEIKAFRILAATARADAWQEQPFLLEYHHFRRFVYQQARFGPIRKPSKLPSGLGRAPRQSARVARNQRQVTTNYPNGIFGSGASLCL
jgi:hypothetical protein